MSPDTIRKGGLAAVVGGVFWFSSALLTVSRPRGCIGDEWRVQDDERDRRPR